MSKIVKNTGEGGAHRHLFADTESTLRDGAHKHLFFCK